MEEHYRLAVSDVDVTHLAVKNRNPLVRQAILGINEAGLATFNTHAPNPHVGGVMESKGRSGSARSNQPGIDLLYGMNHHRDNLSQYLHALISQSITSQVMTTLEYGTMLFLTTILLDRVIGALFTRHRRLSHVLANLTRIDIARQHRFWLCPNAVL